jgi:hypothetical protein
MENNRIKGITSATNDETVPSLKKSQQLVDVQTAGDYCS